ncbi:MAG: hypothetical protein CMJ65_06220 [Planctomycetaceae bacterium]|jgi:Ca2+-binding RTX toxin-like protein|nr:hypothetical protein [Planctomycetaceae bacterium]MDP7275397.1 hypothetical protein [Planctomycetaceae bacterium]
MKFTSWKSFLTRLTSSHRPRPRRARRGVVSIESLESRTLLTTAFYLDFGTALPAAGMSATVEEFREIDGTGTSGYGTGSDLEGHAGLADSDQLDFNSVQYDYNGDAVIDVNDAVALQNAVLPIVERELAPFDIDVIAIGSASLLDVVNTLQGNDTGMPGFDGYGENDVYNFVMELSSPDVLAAGGLIGSASGLYGLAAGEDLFSGTGNNHDEATLTFTDTIVGATSGVAGTDEFNENLAHRVAYTMVHEAMHTFGLYHTKGLTAQEQLLSSGDTIRHGSITRETNNIVTRFDLQLNGSGTLVNNYETLASDPDIGLRDSDHDGVPDFAYVTGTGAHDIIQLTDLGGGVTQVQIDAYFDSALTTLIRSDSYTITQGVDTEGLILIDSSVGDDLVEISGSVMTSVMVRGGEGDDVIEGGSGNDRLFGEDGDDNISGGRGHDWIFGGAGADYLNGNGDSDLIVGNDGDDTMRGESGNDILLGNDGDDRLFGDSGNDWMFGGNGRDMMTGGFGNDFLQGGNGNDFLAGNSGRDHLDGGHGNDVLFGGLDNDRLRGGDGNDYLDGGSGHDRISGDAGNDWMRGGDGNDVMSGGAGHDMMDGQAGRDLMFGGDGNDRMRGGDGNDLMFGQAGNDTMSGDAGNDILVGGPGIDLLFGGPGLDLLLP